MHANRNGLDKARQPLGEYEAIWRQRAGRIADILAEGTAGDKGEEAP